MTESLKVQNMSRSRSIRRNRQIITGRSSDSRSRSRRTLEAEGWMDGTAICLFHCVLVQERSKLSKGRGLKFCCVLERTLV